MDLGPTKTLKEKYCTVDNPPVFEKRASEEFGKDFVRCYLNKRRELQGKTHEPITQEEIDTYYHQACLCMMVSLFLFPQNAKIDNISVTFT